MNAVKKKFASLWVFLIMMTVSPQVYAATTLGDRVKAWIVEMNQWITLVYVIFFIAGAGFIGGAAFGIRNHGRNAQQYPLADALWSAAGGILLVSIGGIIAYAQGSAVGDGAAPANMIKPPTFN